MSVRARRGDEYQKLIGAGLLQPDVDPNHHIAEITVIQSP